MGKCKRSYEETRRAWTEYRGPAHHNEHCIVVPNQCREMWHLHLQMGSAFLSGLGWAGLVWAGLGWRCDIAVYNLTHPHLTPAQCTYWGTIFTLSYHWQQHSNQSHSSPVSAYKFLYYYSFPICTTYPYHCHYKFTVMMFALNHPRAVFDVV